MILNVSILFWKQGDLAQKLYWEKEAWAAKQVAFLGNLLTSPSGGHRSGEKWMALRRHCFGFSNENWQVWPAPLQALRLHGRGK